MLIHEQNNDDSLYHSNKAVIIVISIVTMYTETLSIGEEFTIPPIEGGLVSAACVESV